MPRFRRLAGRLSRRARGGVGRVRAEIRPLPPRYRRWLRMRMVGWVAYHQREVVLDRCRWMGVKALKNPTDAWIYQEIIHETRPEVIVELGSAYGGSTLFLAHMLDLLGGEGMVVSVDHQHVTFAVEHPRIATVTGDTRSPEVINRVRSLCQGRRAMVIHDANHEAPVVIEDLRNYSPLVAPGCYLIVEDGIADLLRPRQGGAVGPGPMVAVERFLREAPEFEVDVERERYLITYNPQGFLRRRS